MAQRLQLFGITNIYIVGKISRSNFFFRVQDGLVREIEHVFCLIFWWFVSYHPRSMDADMFETCVVFWKETSLGFSENGRLVDGFTFLQRGDVLDARECSEYLDVYTP